MRWGEGLIPFCTLCPHLCNETPLAGDTLPFISCFYTSNFVSNWDKIIVVITRVKNFLKRYLDILGGFWVH